MSKRKSDLLPEGFSLIECVVEEINNEKAVFKKPKSQETEIKEKITDYFQFSFLDDQEPETPEIQISPIKKNKYGQEILFGYTNDAYFRGRYPVCEYNVIISNKTLEILLELPNVEYFEMFPDD